MTTLISAYNSDGCIGRCDAKCHDANHPDCDCICGGKNHGVGKQQAIQNTRDQYLDFMDQYNLKHGDQFTYEIPEVIKQLSFSF